MFFCLICYIIGYLFDVEVDKVRDGFDIISEVNIRDVV